MATSTSASKLLDVPYVTGLAHPPSPVTGAISAHPVFAPRCLTMAGAGDTSFCLKKWLSQPWLGCLSNTSQTLAGWWCCVVFMLKILLFSTLQPPCFLHLAAAHSRGCWSRTWQASFWKTSKEACVQMIKGLHHEVVCVDLANSQVSFPFFLECFLRFLPSSMSRMYLSLRQISL